MNAVEFIKHNQITIGDMNVSSVLLRQLDGADLELVSADIRDVRLDLYSNEDDGVIADRLYCLTESDIEGFCRYYMQSYADLSGDLDAVDEFINDTVDDLLGCAQTNEDECLYWLSCDDQIVGIVTKTLQEDGSVRLAPYISPTVRGSGLISHLYPAMADILDKYCGERVDCDLTLSENIPMKRIFEKVGLEQLNEAPCSDLEKQVQFIDIYYRPETLAI